MVCPLLARQCQFVLLEDCFLPRLVLRRVLCALCLSVPQLLHLLSVSLEICCILRWSRSTVLLFPFLTRPRVGFPVLVEFGLPHLCLGPSAKPLLRAPLLVRGCALIPLGS